MLSQKLGEQLILLIVGNVPGSHINQVQHFLLDKANEQTWPGHLRERERKTASSCVSDEMKNFKEPDMKN